MAYEVKSLRGDLYGGIVAAVVSLPLALAFGVTSGLGAIAGLYGAMTVGMLAALFGGTPGQTSGPTAPMAVAVAVIVANHTETIVHETVVSVPVAHPSADSVDVTTVVTEEEIVTNLNEVFTILIMAGLIQIIMGLSKAGRFVSYTPYSVISGFMSGIGLMIIIINVLPFLGEPVAQGGPREVLRLLPGAVGDFNLNGFLVATLTLGVAVFWPRRLNNHLPNYLAALLIGTVIGELWLTGSPTIGEVPVGFPELRMPDLAIDQLVSALQPAMILALLGSIDSLVTSLTVDALCHTRHKPDKELLGQGIGNTAAGMIGALPGAGATMDTMVNIRSGGRTPVSGVVRCLVILGLVLGLGRYVEAIPHAVMAGILVKIGWEAIDWQFIKRSAHIQRTHLTVMLLTMGLTVFVDIVAAVAMGLIAAGLASSRQLERLQLDSVVSVPLLDHSFLDDDLDNFLAGKPPAADQPAPEEDHEEAFSARAGLIKLRGSFTVASSNRLVETIGADIRDHEIVILDFSETVYVDDSASMVVDQMINIAAEEKTECIVMGLRGLPAETLRGFDVFQRIPDEHFVETLDEARELVKQILEFKPPED